MGNYTVISMAYAWQLNKAFDDVILINLKLKLSSVYTAVIINYLPLLAAPIFGPPTLYEI